MALNRLHHAAQAQHGVFTRRQALESGFGRSAINHRIDAGIWVAVDHGVYREAATPTSWRQRLAAACLSGPAVGSHRAAAVLWDAPGIDEIVEVAALRHLRRHAPDVVWHESRHLDDVYVTTVDGIPVTRPTRTILDLGAVLDAEQLVRVYDDFTRRRLVSHSTVSRALDSLGPRRLGAGVVRSALALRAPDEPVPESVLESDFDRVVRAAGLPRPVRQYAIRDSEGRLLARVDFAFPEHRIGVELDGVRYHDPEADSVRDLRLAAFLWRIVRVQSRQLHRDPSLVVAALRGALARDERRI